MPIRDIDDLDKMVNAFGRIELKRLIRLDSVSENLVLEEKLWDIKIKKKLVKLLFQSPLEVKDHFDKHINNYKNEWLESVKENFDIDESNTKSGTTKWQENIKNQLPSERSK